KDATEDAGTGGDGQSGAVLAGLRAGADAGQVAQRHAPQGGAIGGHDLGVHACHGDDVPDDGVQADDVHAQAGDAGDAPDAFGAGGVLRGGEPVGEGDGHASTSRVVARAARARSTAVV